jgi:hypothetical protein
MEPQPLHRTFAPMDLTSIAHRLEPPITPAEFDEFRAVVEAVGPSHYVVKSNGSAIEFASIYSTEGSDPEKW